VSDISFRGTIVRAVRRSLFSRKHPRSLLRDIPRANGERETI